MKLRWRKICEWRWESELTLAGGYAVDRATGSASFTVLKLKPRASTKEQMRWDLLGGAWSVPDAKRMALQDADGTTKRFTEKARAERATAKRARACPKCGSEQTHRCKTGECLHCDACEHLWFPGQPDCSGASQAKFNESRS